MCSKFKTCSSCVSASRLSCFWTTNTEWIEKCIEEEFVTGDFIKTVSPQGKLFCPQAYEIVQDREREFTEYVAMLVGIYLILFLMIICVIFSCINWCRARGARLTPVRRPNVVGRRLAFSERMELQRQGNRQAPRPPINPLPRPRQPRPSSSYNPTPAARPASPVPPPPPQQHSRPSRNPSPLARPASPAPPPPPPRLNHSPQVEIEPNNAQAHFEMQAIVPNPVFNDGLGRGRRRRVSTRQEDFVYPTNNLRRRIR